MLFCSKILNKEAILIREKKTVKFILGFILMAVVLTACGSTKKGKADGLIAYARFFTLCKKVHRNEGDYAR